MANLQNPKRVNIQMDNMISQVHWGDEKSLIRLQLLYFIDGSKTCG
jgi:hypothetical protein